MTLRLPNAMDPRLRAPRIEAAPVDLAGALIEVANLLAAATPEELGAAIRTISETMAATTGQHPARMTLYSLRSAAQGALTR